MATGKSRTMSLLLANVREASLLISLSHVPADTHCQLNINRASHLEQTLSRHVAVSNSATAVHASSTAWYVNQVGDAFRSRLDDVFGPFERNRSDGVTHL